MDVDEIRDVLIEVVGDNPRTKIVNGWLAIRCPLARWTHETGKDSRESAGISINPAGVSIFNCLAGNTKVITRQGLKSISTLAGTTPELLMPDGTWKVAPVQQFGEQQLWEVSLTRNGRNRTVRATANHRWFSRKHQYAPMQECVTSDLVVGSAMMSSTLTRRDDWTIDEMGLLHGLMFGDGTANLNDRHGRVLLFGKCRPLAFRFVNLGYNVTTHSGEDAGEYNVVSGDIAYMKEFPGRGKSEAYMLGFMAGILAADGCVDERGNVSIASSKLGIIQKYQDILLGLGISCFGVSAQSRTGLGTVATNIHTVRLVGHTLDPAFFVVAQDAARFTARAETSARIQWRVTGVRPTENIETVYCATVEGYGAFTLEGNLVTGNCFTCKNTSPLSGFVRKMANYTGENHDSLIEELEDESYLGARTLPEWDSLKGGEPPLVPLKQAIYLDLYDSAAGHPYLRARGITDDTAELLQLKIDPEDPADRCARILFPVFGSDGELYGLSGRDVTGTAKLKVRDYMGLKKARNVLGAHLVVKERPDKIVVVEGLFDYANCWQQGYAGVAVMHSTMTEAQADIIRGFSLPTYLVYDDDQAGKKGVELAGPLLRDYVPTMKVRYPKIWIEDDSEAGGHWLKDPGEMQGEDFDEMIRDARLY